MITTLRTLFQYAYCRNELGDHSCDLHPGHSGLHTDGEIFWGSKSRIDNRKSNR